MEEQQGLRISKDFGRNYTGIGVTKDKKTFQARLMEHGKIP
jgi:hypothetical protein